MNPLNDLLFIIPEEKQSAEFTISGNGFKRLVVVIDRDNYDAQEAELLHKMMLAIKYNIKEDVFLIEVDKKTSLSLANLISVWDNLILFGIPPYNLGLNIQYKPYVILPLEEKNVIYVEDLKSISANNSKKQAIWGLFQKLFLNQ